MNVNIYVRTISSSNECYTEAKASLINIKSINKQFLKSFWFFIDGDFLDSDKSVHFLTYKQFKKILKKYIVSINNHNTVPPLIFRIGIDLLIIDIVSISTYSNIDTIVFKDIDWTWKQYFKNEGETKEISSD